MATQSEISAGTTRPRTHGMRLSALDVIVLAAGILVGIVGLPLSGGLSLFVPFVVLHFFLFCNVFRVRRVPELIWAGTFVVNCGVWCLAGSPNLLAICGCQLPITVLLIGYELRQPVYHGIFARQINPRLDDYLTFKI